LNGALVLLNPKNISIGDNYHGCHGVIEIFHRLTGLKKLGLDCPAEELQAGDVILLETPLNPDGTAFNIEHYAQKAHSRGAFLIVDSTFGPPGLQDPFEFGADIIMHSGSKYFGGHSDLLCGVLVTKRKDWFDQLFAQRLHPGNNMGNLESWLGVRSLRTLELRVQRASQNATSVVSFLYSALTESNAASGSDAEAVSKVLGEIRHASLQTEPWVKKQMPNGYGPVFSIIMKDENLARRLPSKLQYFHHATSLGGVESLIEWRAMSDTRVDRRLLRVSIGIEHWEDLRDDFVSAFKALID
jgi:cystathionine beta-lyase